MLTAKQSRFCEEYMVDLNGTQAAIRAGYSEASARQIADENLSKPVIRDKISALQAEKSNELGITSKWVMEQFKAIYERSVSIGELNAANKSVEMLGKMIGAFEVDNNQKTKSITVNLPK